MSIFRYNFLVLFLLCISQIQAQDVSLYQQFNGRYDFLFFGNTMNPMENHIMPTPEIFTSSSAGFTLNDGDIIHRAFLYWAGCGMGDFEVELNSQPLVAERTFHHQRMWQTLTMDYFSAFYDVTPILQNTGAGTYTLSELDAPGVFPHYFYNKTNFAGWAVIVIVENPDFPLNQLNLYDGMQAVPDELTITLNSLNVIDNVGAKIGFLAWEGDKNIASGETLSLNGQPLSNPPLNPENNAFNGTNSFTGSDELYNMDLDVYDIQDYISITDSVATIRLTSGQDVVMINAIVTKLNSQLPDATISIDSVALQCSSRILTVDFT
ncbi:MAG: gliding motility-associated C-terminal domain-containing protein, partial [Flavobacterium sp.]|nr:gliding motility-associated C-terminal domain-containing protein [Flavobacterium sp.]